MVWEESDKLSRPVPSIHPLLRALRCSLSLTYRWFPALCVGLQDTGAAPKLDTADFVIRYGSQLHSKLA